MPNITLALPCSWKCATVIWASLSTLIWCLSLQRDKSWCLLSYVSHELQLSPSQANLCVWLHQSTVNYSCFFILTFLAFLSFSATSSKCMFCRKAKFARSFSQFMSKRMCLYYLRKKNLPPCNKNVFNVIKIDIKQLQNHE